MSIQYINEYHREIANLRDVSKTTNEMVLRKAFQNCLDKYCRRRDLTLLPEQSDENIRPDGTVVNAMGLPRGHWEAKDENDDLDREIGKKNRKGYPDGNIIYENTQTAILIQDGEESMRVPMTDTDKLNHLITSFFNYESPTIKDFHKAIEKFKIDLPSVLEKLREVVEKSYSGNKNFAAAADAFLELCKGTINPDVEAADVREMLIQHILTKDIFLKVFGEDQFHRENNIAVQLDKLESKFFIGNVRRALMERMKVYYSAITSAAAMIENHREKQRFLKIIYENFYQVYNPKSAKRLGVVYTPNEIVDFMIRATDQITKKHFERGLCDKKVHILDPAVGTGTYIADLIEFIPSEHIEYKYENEIHANEVGILPYYIANLNIEYTYARKTKKYKTFPNICFVDTLDNTHFRGKGQSDLIGAMSHENLQRVKRQNEKDISVIIGNPPYYDSQRNENDNNKSRKYKEVDKRIKETYVAESDAQRTHQYDMYKRFLRWSSDRIKDAGVVAFITNRSYLDSYQDDGFRKIVSGEFDALYVVDLGGDIRVGDKTGNVFGILTGVAIGFFVRKGSGSRQCEIRYCEPTECKNADDKLAWLSQVRFDEIKFTHITPDKNHNWLNQTDNDFDELLPVVTKITKLAKSEVAEDAVFKLYSLGVQTNRDDWVYDFDKATLRKKVKYFADFYNAEIARFQKEKPEKDGSTTEWLAALPTEIKWTSELKSYLKKGENINYANNSITESLYRPFVNQFLCYQEIVIHRLYKIQSIFPSGKVGENKVIACRGVSANHFVVLGANQITGTTFLKSGNGVTSIFPLYRYQDGNRVSNITNFGLKQFRDHYENTKITAEDIFHYTYAVLHNSVYLEKYTINLQREFPRLPFYTDFARWVEWGAALMDLHINFEKQKPHSIKRVDKKTPAGDTKLKAGKKAGKIIIDAQTTISGIPAAAWKYQLGNRSALEWVLSQYKEKKPRDPTVREKFNTYRFADYKEQVIDLLGKVCTVSVKTVEITNQMRTENAE